MVSYSLVSKRYIYSVDVLILIVVEDGLVRIITTYANGKVQVLILIVVEDGLVLDLIRHY